MKHRLKTSRYNDYGFKQGNLVELLATRSNSKNVLVNIPLGAALFDSHTTIVSPLYSRRKHLNAQYGWVPRRVLELVEQDINNASVAYILSRDCDS